MELKKDKTAITKLESENAEFRDRVTKVEQRQMHDDNSSNINSSNINSVADQVSKANSHHEKPLVDKEMDTLLPEEPMIAIGNIPVMEQCDQTSWKTKKRMLSWMRCIRKRLVMRLDNAVGIRNFKLKSLFQYRLKRKG